MAFRGSNSSSYYIIFYRINSIHMLLNSSFSLLTQPNGLWKTRLRSREYNVCVCVNVFMHRWCVCDCWQKGQLHQQYNDSKFMKCHEISNSMCVCVCVCDFIDDKSVNDKRMLMKHLRYHYYIFSLRKYKFDSVYKYVHK